MLVSVLQPQVCVILEIQPRRRNMNSKGTSYVKRPNTEWSEKVQNGCLQVRGQDTNKTFD